MKTFVEASFKVDVTGLPPIFMDARSSVEIRKKLRKQLKFPDDIENIERITKGEKIKSFKDRLKSTLSAKGQDVEEAKASEDMLIDPKKMGKKSTFLAPQNKDKLKMDLARLKKALGPNHPMNKNNKVDEQTVKHHHDSMDYFADKPGKPSHDEIKKHMHKHGGDSLKIKSVSHSKDNGTSVHFKGHVKHVMKLANYTHDEKYPHNDKGYKSYAKDMGMNT